MNGFWGFLVITIASPILLLCDLWFIHGFVCRLVFPLVLQQLLLLMLPKDLKMPESWLRCEHANFIYMAFCHDSDNLPVTWVCRSFSPALGRDTSPAFYSVRYMTLFEEWGRDSEPCTISSALPVPSLHLTGFHDMINMKQWRPWLIATSRVWSFETLPALILDLWSCTEFCQVSCRPAAWF